jgi:hypothetical protein
MRRPLIIYDFFNCSIPNFLISEENLIFFFISVGYMCDSGASFLCVHNNAIAGPHEKPLLETAYSMRLEKHK